MTASEKSKTTRSRISPNSGCMSRALLFFPMLPPPGVREHHNNESLDRVELLFADAVELAPADDYVVEHQNLLAEGRLGGLLEVLGQSEVRTRRTGFSARMGMHHDELRCGRRRDRTEHVHRRELYAGAGALVNLYDAAAELVARVERHHEEHFLVRRLDVLPHERVDLLGVPDRAELRGFLQALVVGRVTGDGDGGSAAELLRVFRVLRDGYLGAGRAGRYGVHVVRKFAGRAKLGVVSL